MAIVRLDKQPPELIGGEYDGLPYSYEWFEFRAAGKAYAKVGVLFHVANDESTPMAFLYWRIVKKPLGIRACRELVKTDVPAMREYCHQRGALAAQVATTDSADTHFEKLVRLMGFEYLSKIATTEVGHVRRWN